MRRNTKYLLFNTFRLGTITGVSPGIRFHTAVNKFCFNASINKNVEVYKTALDQFRPYLSLKDAFKVFEFCIKKNFKLKDLIIDKSKIPIIYEKGLLTKGLSRGDGLVGEDILNNLKTINHPREITIFRIKKISVDKKQFSLEKLYFL